MESCVKRQCVNSQEIIRLGDAKWERKNEKFKMYEDILFPVYRLNEMVLQFSLIFGEKWIEMNEERRFLKIETSNFIILVFFQKNW